MTEGDTMTDTSPQAALHAALSKAQAEFPPIPRDKTVTVKTRDGRQYTFPYAPLDTILDKVRPALAKHEFAISQWFNGEEMTTALLHASGGLLTSTWIVQRAGGSWQEFGSAITYARRYAIAALLGVAPEEDDDGSHAEGHTVEKYKAPAATRKPRKPPATDDGPDVQQLTVDLLNLSLTLGKHDEVAERAKSHRERNTEEAHLEWLRRQIATAEERVSNLEEVPFE